MSTRSVQVLDAANSPDYRSALRRFLQPFENSYYYEGTLRAHTDISRFFGWIDFLETFGPVAGLHTLDVGCGSGGMPLAMLSRGVVEAHGVEVDPGLFELCRTRFEGVASAHVALGDGRLLPYDDDTFDVVTSIHVVEHTLEPTAFVGEVLRVLKPGGRGLLECPNRMFPFEPHNNIPLIPYLPKRLANILCASVVVHVPAIGEALRVRLRNVQTSFNHFLSTGRLKHLVERAGGVALLVNPEGRFLGSVPLPSIVLRWLQTHPRVLRLASRLISRDAMVVFQKKGPSA